MKKSDTLKAFIKKNVFSCTCLLLALLVLITGTFSYARYVSSETANHGSAAGNFSVSASIDGISGLSFTNTSFWSDDDTKEIAMNALRSLKFSVNNFETDAAGGKTPSSVDLKYTLCFSAPKNFAQRLAIQLFDDTGEAFLPQIVIAELIGAAGGSYSTGTANYNGTDTAPLTFAVAKDGSTYTATAGATVIKIEEYTKAVTQKLLFRLWDTSALTSAEHPSVDYESGKVLSPVEISFTEEVAFYRITIAAAAFTLPSGVAQTDEYTLKLAPTDALEDVHIGGSIIDAEHNAITSIYGGDTSWYISSLEKNEQGEHSYSEIKFDDVARSQTDENGTTSTMHYDESSPLELYENGLQKLYLSRCYSKSYPFFVNVIFEQTQ